MEVTRVVDPFWDSELLWDKPWGHSWTNFSDFWLCNILGDSNHMFLPLWSLLHFPYQTNHYSKQFFPLFKTFLPLCFLWQNLPCNYISVVLINCISDLFNESSQYFSLFIPSTLWKHWFQLLCSSQTSVQARRVILKRSLISKQGCACTLILSTLASRDVKYKSQELDNLVQLSISCNFLVWISF